MKKVLIPTDFSDNAWDALTYAIQLYDDIPCTFYILNTYEANPSRIPNGMHQFVAGKVLTVLRKESEEKLEEIIDHLNSNMLNDKHRYRTISKSGALVSVVEGVAEKEHIDVIVMGTAGATGLKEVFMGSNTVKVINTIAYCPVISVPEKYVYEEPARVIFATDFKKHLSKQDLKCLIELQLIYDFNIQFVHIEEEEELSEIQQYNIDSLKTYFDPTVISFKEIDSNHKISRAITTFAEKEKTNMVCLANYEHSFIEKLTHEPVVKKVSFHSTVPILILPS